MPLGQTKIAIGQKFETKDGYFGEIRTLAKYRRLRMHWQDPNWEKQIAVEIMLVSRPNDRSLLVFNHLGIHDSRTQGILRKRWKEAVAKISASI